MDKNHCSRWLASTLAVLIASSPAIPAANPDATQRAREGINTREDLEIVDCLLPGQVRQLGAMTYVSQRRPTRTTAADCRVRGGEYVAYDRADAKSALRVWLAAAEAGDADAQNTVGEIYERGLGDVPNYEAAAIWYQKAADQGYSRAQFNLGTLYEQGLGVQIDRLKALNLYRTAWGLPQDSLIYQQTADQQVALLREQLEQQVIEKDAQVDALVKQVDGLQAQLRGSQDQTNAALAQQAQTLAKLAEALRADSTRSRAQLAQLPPSNTRELRTPDTSAPVTPQAYERFVKGLNFGRYYAIVIGNQNYQNVSPLQTPHSDAERAAKLLQDKYGFNVRIIEDASDDAMLGALNDLNKILTDNDNVLIYYAGHGSRQKAVSGDIGYWLPVNAESPPSLKFWVGNDQVSSYLSIFKARRVLVVADSCYSGLLSADPGLIAFSSQTQAALDYLKFKLPKRGRLLLASGGDAPVRDVGGSGNSVFARAFIDVLESNDQLLSTPALFARLQEHVRDAAKQGNFDQTPELKSIKSAGHEVGDFFFVPKGT
ncbi:MAG: caspase family protein [Nevskiaceae bacterium]|jgi:hypothetical protein|nr:caspase family protein [Nevskiaceae bacterium]